MPKPNHTSSQATSGMQTDLFRSRTRGSGNKVCVLCPVSLESEGSSPGVKGTLCMLRGHPAPQENHLQGHLEQTGCVRPSLPNVFGMLVRSTKALGQRLFTAHNGPLQQQAAPSPFRGTVVTPSPTPACDYSRCTRRQSALRTGSTGRRDRLWPQRQEQPVPPCLTMNRRCR